MRIKNRYTVELNKKAWDLLTTYQKKFKNPETKEDYKNKGLASECIVKHLEPKLKGADCET